MKSLTLHNIDDAVYERLVKMASDQNLSLNIVAKVAMGDGLGINPNKKRRDLSWMQAYKWTKEEADNFDKLIEQEFEQIDPEDWK